MTVSGSAPAEEYLCPAFMRDVRRLVHDAGAVSLDRLVAHLQTWDCERGDALAACVGDDVLDVVDGIALSRRVGSLLDVGVRRALSVRNPQPLPSVFVGALRHLRMRNADILPTFDEFEAFVHAQDHYAIDGELVWADCRLPDPAGLERALMDALIYSPGGLAPREQLVDAAERQGFSASSARQHTSLSPLLDFACTGVLRRRGDTIDLRVAEVLRRQARTGPRWAPWGWVGDTRLWIQSRVTGPGLSPSPPRDVEALLMGRVFRCLAADRTELGALKFDMGGTTSWEHAAAPVEEVASSVLEFEVGRHPAVVVLSGETAEEEDEYPGDVDACVLHDGRWWAVLRVDRSLLEGAPHLLPHVLLRHADLQVGDERSLSVEEDVVVLRREPHAGVLHGLGTCLRRREVTRGTWIRVAVTPSGMLLEVIGRPEPGTTDELRAHVGLGPRDGEQRAYAAIGSALGLGGVADRVAVARALTRRGRADLARLATAASAGRPRGGATTGPIAYVAHDGPVLVRDAGGADLVPSAGNAGVVAGPLGVQWVRPSSAQDGHSDVNWDRWVRAFLRAWFAASTRGPVLIELRDGRWFAEGIGHRRLLDALEAVDVATGMFVELPEWRVVSLPTTGLGFIHLVRDASQAGVTSVQINRDAVVATWMTHSTTGLGLVDALVPVPDPHVADAPREGVASNAENLRKQSADADFDSAFSAHPRQQLDFAEQWVSKHTERLAAPEKDELADSIAFNQAGFVPGEESTEHLVAQSQRVLGGILEALAVPAQQRERELPPPGQPWPYARGDEVWSLSRAKRSLFTVDGQLSLDDCWPRAAVDRLLDAFFDIRPEGGRVWIDDDGDATTYVDGVLTYLGQVART